MKKNDLEQRIRAKALQAMPDVFDRIPFASAPIGVLEPRTRRTFPLYRTLASAMIAIVFTVVTAIVVLSYENPSVYALETDAETIGYQVLSGAMFLQNEEVIDADPLAFTLLDTETSLFEENIDLFAETFAVLETLIGAKDDLAFQLSESDDPAFVQMIQIEVSTLDGETVAYQIYLNQTLRRRIAMLEGEIRFSEASYQFRYVRLTGSEKSRLTIENGMDTLVVTHQTSTAEEMSFQYQWIQSGAPYRSVQLRLTKNEGALSAELATQAGNQNLMIRMERAMMSGMPTLISHYRFGNGTVVETGDVDVVAEFDPIQDRVVYHMNGQVRRGNQTEPVQTEEVRPGKGNMMPGHGPR